jgi:hypothetical protein
MTGPDRPRCGADRGEKHGHAQCSQPAGWGTDHQGIGACKLHGGATGTHRSAALEERRRQAAAHWALPIEVGPGEALLQEVHRSAGMVAWLEVKVEEVAGQDPTDLIFGTTKETRRYIEGGDGDEPGGGKTDMTEERSGTVHGWLKLLQAERRHLREVCRDALAAGIEERRVQIAEAQAAQIVAVLRAVFADPELGLTAEQSGRLGAVVPRHLRAVRAG